MRCQSCMWDSQAYVDILFDQIEVRNSDSIYPESITLHPARLAPQPRISIASTGLKYQNLMEYDCMRDLFKTLEKTTISPIFHIIIFQSILPPTRKKNKKNLFRFIFSKKNGFWLYATVFLVYYAFCGVRRSVSICGVR